MCHNSPKSSLSKTIPGNLTLDCSPPARNSYLSAGLYTQLDSSKFYQKSFSVCRETNILVWPTSSTDHAHRMQMRMTPNSGAGVRLFPWLSQAAAGVYWGK